MSFDMYGPMNDMPAGTTINAQVANASLHAGERINKTPIFISGVETRAFLAWLRESCHSKLTAQRRAENLVVVPATDDGFRAAVSELRSLTGRVV